MNINKLDNRIEIEINDINTLKYFDNDEDDFINLEPTPEVREIQEFLVKNTETPNVYLKYKDSYVKI